MQFENSLSFAQKLDQEDPLKEYRNQFHFPKTQSGTCRYFCGNSLGLEPKTARDSVIQEMDDWAEFGVEGHFDAKTPWFSYQDIFPEQLSKLVGAQPKEVTVMNGLTVNLNLLMVSFYGPTEQRFKIICEAKAFPSDQYALEQQARFHGLNPKDAIVEVAPREGEDLIAEEDILKAISEHGDSVALVIFGGVNYYTGQVFNMKRITEAGHEVGAQVGFDLAHGAGNIPLELHDWDVDFACWCSYKYLNSGPGNVSGMFVHERHCNNPDLPRFAGWWGNDPDARFKMEPGFVPAEGARGWQISNVPVFGMAVHKSALDIHAEVGMDRLREKSLKLTGFLEFLLDDIQSEDVRIITPRNPDERGCQISLYVEKEAKALHKNLTDQGVISDYREPNVIRLAPVPLYNSFEDVWVFADILRTHLNA
jgi:kynureninase